MLSGLLLNYFLTDPRRTLRVDDPDTALTVVVMLAMAVAVAALVDGAANRQRQARRASREAELLTLFSGSVLRGADLADLLERIRETYAQRAVSLLRGRGDEADVIARVGEKPDTTTESADTVVEVKDGEFRLLMSGRALPPGDLKVLAVVARQAAALVRQRELAEEAGESEAIRQADQLRRSLLSAVSHDLRTPLAGAKAAVSSLRSEDIDFSKDDTAELLATVEESVDQLTALVDNLLDSSRLAAGAVRPALRQVYLDEVVQRSLLSITRGATGSGRNALDRVTVEVGDAVALADPGLLERVLANIVDNALRYGGDSVVRINAGTVAGRTLINVIDEGPGVPRGVADQLFEPFQRLGDRNNKYGVGLGLSVARGFAEAMGGTISATDTPGGGLTILVDLPAPRPAAR